MAGRSRPPHVVQLRDQAPPLLARPPTLLDRPPASILYPDAAALSGDPLLSSRRLPVHPAVIALEKRLSAQTCEIQELLLDNQRLATTHVALKQDLEACQHDLRVVAADASKIRAERDAEVRGLYERSIKAKAEMEVCDGMRAELAQVLSQVQRLTADRDELVEQLQGIRGELASARADHGQASAIMAEIEMMRKEVQKGRAAVEYEKKAHAENLEQSRMMENNMISMAREVEKLRAELANVENRARAAAAAAANPGTAYTGDYVNPETAYAGSSYATNYIMYQVQPGSDSGIQFGSAAAPNGLYETQQIYAQR